MNKLPQYFCVKNDGSKLFKDTVIAYLNKIYKETLQGDSDNCFYGVDSTGLVWNNNIDRFDGRPTILTIEDFIEATTVFVESAKVETAFALPKNWHIIVTPENRGVVSKWRMEHIKNSHTIIDLGLAVGCCSGSNTRDHNPSTNLVGQNYDFGIEITFDQFKQYVLKDVKKIVGYNLIKPQYQKAAIAITGYNENSITSFQAWMVKNPDGEFAKKLKEANVLDTWFEPIYAKKSYAIGDWVFITGKSFTGNGLNYRGDDDGVFKLLAINEEKHPSGHAREDSQFMFELNGHFYRTADVSILRFATAVEILNAKHKTILDDVKKQYPVGTKFYPAHVGIESEYCIVTNTNFRINLMDDDDAIIDCEEIDSIIALTDSAEEWCSDAKYGNTLLSRTVYNCGKWAKIESKPIIRIKGYNAKFSENAVSFGCQKYTKEFIITLNDCLQANGFKMDCKDDIKIMSDWFNSIK
jgi:hypothetical protein